MNRTFTHLIVAACAMTVAGAAKADFTPIRIASTDTIYGEAFKQTLGYSSAFYGNQLVVGSTSSNLSSANSCLYVYNINENGKAIEFQKIDAPYEANKKFFGYQVALSDKYLIATANTAKKAYIYAKQSDGTWTSDSVLSVAMSGNLIDVYDNKFVVVNNKRTIVASINKDGNGVYSITNDRIAESANKFEGADEINIASNAVALRGNVLALYVLKVGAYIYEYSAENGWEEKAFVEVPNAINAPQGIAVGENFISAVLGSPQKTEPCQWLVIEKTGDTWENPTSQMINTTYVSQSYRTAIFGNVVAVSDNSASSVDPHHAEFYTKVDGEWTLIKYIQSGAGIAMSNAFNGKYYVATNQLLDSETETDCGGFFVYDFITDIDYTVTEPKDLDYNGEPQTPTLEVNVAKEYNANVTYSTTADGVYTAELPSYTEAGEYTLFYKIEAEGYSTVVESVTFNVDQVKPLVVTAACEVEFAKAQVRAEGKNVIVENAIEKSINVYNIAGSLVYSKTSAGAKEVIALDKSGIYIVEVNGTASKVVVK